MKKLALILFALTTDVHATMVVVDPALIAHAVTSFVKQVAQYAQEVQTTINTNTTALRELQQIENEVLALERMGDPRAMINLPGVSNLQTLAAIYQQAQIDVARISSLANPQGTMSSAQQILQMYQQPLYGFAGGNYRPATTSLFQFEAADYNTITDTQSQLSQLNGKLQELNQQRTQILSTIQSGGDASFIEKQHIALDGINAGIADVHAQMAQAARNGELQQQKNQSAQQISRANVTLQSARSFGGEVNESISTLQSLSNNYGAFPHWPEQ